MDKFLYFRQHYDNDDGAKSVESSWTSCTLGYFIHSAINHQLCAIKMRLLRVESFVACTYDLLQSAALRFYSMTQTY